MAALVKPDDLKRIQQEIRAIYESDTLAGWLKLGDILLSLYKNYPEKLQDVKQIICEFYSQYMKLQLEPSHQAVWRGHQLLKLEKQQFDILENLFELGGQIYNSGQKLVDVAGSPSNLNTLMSRIRKVIEPIGGRKYTVYIQNNRDRGYWLESFTTPTRIINPY
jgi:DNA-binding response OmpR family regulator